ncbi:cytochrome P450 [Acidiferrimicrobium sp. IK]|uniref:cytochrome P450 n=1 Tax=Acidiferrimicrobium sp. IK TaxID=2871700 RepID=UPI0021CB110B|nr:cytochrome P450 [Acidiferrimicrobium sp. IK]
MQQLAVPRYVPPSAATWRSPWPMYQTLRREAPVLRVEPPGHPDRDYWVLSRYDDVLWAARDSRTYSSADGLTTNYGELERLGMVDSPPLVMQDPPGHSAFRRLVARGFTPRRVAGIEPAVREFVRSRIDALADAGGGDIVAALFKPLPSMVVAHYLGVPGCDRDHFDDWTDAIVAANATGDPAAALARASTAMADLAAYFTQLAAWREGHPGEDALSDMVAAGAGLDAVLGFAFTMVTGGNDTTTGLLGGSVQLLADHPAQRRLLCDHPGLLPDAIEELLRLTCPVQALARTTTGDVRVRDVTIPAGRKVLLLYASANRDEQHWGDDADQLDVERRPRNILTFSHGAHHCLGAAAARLQARVALEELLGRCPDFDVDTEGVTYADGPYVRRPTSVSFRVL